MIGHISANLMSLALDYIRSRFDNAYATVQLSTFAKWNIDNYIGYESSSEDGKIVITKIWCRTCSKYYDKIKGDSRIRGQAKKELTTYVDGTTYVTKHNVQRHLETMVRPTDHSSRF